VEAPVDVEVAAPEEEAASVTPAAEAQAALEANRIPPVGIDSSVTQGNRVVSAAQVTPENPVKVLEDKIRSHFDAVTPVVAELRRTADEVEALLNQLRVGTAN
jgi:hypothetical protein